MVTSSKSQRAALRRDGRLQFDFMMPESLVMADQHAAVKTFPGLVHTAPQAMKDGSTRSHRLNRKESDVEGQAVDWGEVVTR